jgi:hypothetical protein
MFNWWMTASSLCWFRTWHCENKHLLALRLLNHHHCLLKSLEPSFQLRSPSPSLSFQRLLNRLLYVADFSYSIWATRMRVNMRYQRRTTDASKFPDNQACRSRLPLCASSVLIRRGWPLGGHFMPLGWNPTAALWSPTFFALISCEFG